MFKWLKVIWEIILCQRGEGDTGQGAGNEGGQGEGPEGGQATPPGQEGQQGIDGGEGGQGIQPPATPKFGEFGDTPKTPEEALALAEKIYEAHSKIKPEFDTLKGKAAKVTATERNLAMTRKALENMGIKAVQDENGGVSFELLNPPAKQERKLHFNDEAIGKLAYHFQGDKNAAKQFVDLIRLAVQDEAESLLETREKASSQRSQQMQAIVAEKDSIEKRMLKMFPMLEGKWDNNSNPTNPNFNQAFFDLATKIWEEQYDKHPLKQLYAALDAADELGIGAQAIQQAKKEGFQAGQTNKKVIGPASGGKKGGASGWHVLPKSEYLALSPEKREEYDKWRLENPDK